MYFGMKNLKYLFGKEYGACRLPRWLSKESSQAWDAGSIPGSGRPVKGGNGNPLQYCCLKKFHGQRSLEGHGVTKESDTAEWLSRAPGAYTVSYVWSWKGSEAVLLIEYIKNSSVKQTHFCWVGHSKTRSKSMPIQSCFPIFIRLLVAFKVESKELWRSYKYVIVFWILNWSQYGKASEQHWVQSDDSTAFVSVIITSTLS